MRLLTIGYERLALSEFLDVLQAHGVHQIIDVRELPLSRKRGFSKSPLSVALAGVDIGYFHARLFGTPKPIRDALKNTGNWKAYERSYLKFLAPREIYFSELLAFEDACLLCFEANPLECHRSLITRRMEELDLVHDVQHLQPIKTGNPYLVSAG